jgi:ppGpp synthetase/RelA/SpoT-type nucleotidyltranferase
MSLSTKIILDPHGEELLQQFRDLVPSLKKIEKLASNKLKKALDDQGIYVTAIEHRVKTESSLAGKLLLKGAKYHSINDITDLVGFRIITFYSDDVDKVAIIAKKLFEIDWKESVDKRKLHELNSFGYNSLHYICRLPTNDPALNNIRFELQMRTALQHVWSTIEHDTGYKGNVKILDEHRRQFSRLAGMLELIDDEFSRLRNEITEYRRNVQSLVHSGKLDDVALTVDSFKSYLEMRPFERLNQRIASVNQAEIFPASLMGFLPLLVSFGFETLSDVDHFIKENSEDAYQLALAQIALTDLDILAENIGLQNLCLVHVLKQGRGREGLQFVYKTINGEQNNYDVLIDMIMDMAKNLPFWDDIYKK